MAKKATTKKTTAKAEAAPAKAAPVRREPIKMGTAGKDGKGDVKAILNDLQAVYDKATAAQEGLSGVENLRLKKIKRSIDAIIKIHG